VGYRQAWRFLDGQGTFEEFRQDSIAATRQLAKRQMTWLRSMPNVTVIDPTLAAALAAVELL
jgi:tRNA dimethylallyltransferase